MSGAQKDEPKVTKSRGPKGATGVTHSASFQNADIWTHTTVLRPCKPTDMKIDKSSPNCKRMKILGLCLALRVKMLAEDNQMFAISLVPIQIGKKNTPLTLLIFSLAHDARIVFIRHGESQWNSVFNKAGDRLDSGLGATDSLWSCRAGRFSYPFAWSER